MPINILSRLLLVALNIEAILGETSLARRKKILQKVARTGVGLDSVYAQTLQRIREQKGDRSRLGIEVLVWVSHSVRPLQISELRHALAVEMELTDLDPENIPPWGTVLASCLGLVVVDEKTSTVRLIHYTLQEYLSGPGILPNAHKTLGQTCLAYLNSECVKGLPVDIIPNLADMAFLEYSSLYWGIHTKEGLSDGAKSLALELLNRYDNHISSTLLFKHIEHSNSSSFTPYLFTGLHCASYFGIVEVITALAEMGDRNLDQKDCMGRTPLVWAARQANEEVVRLLLTWGDVNPDEPDNSGRTALSWASSLGCEGVVRLLLTRNDVNPDRSDNDGQTALWWASQGNKEVIKLLPTWSYINLERSDNGGQTALSWAFFPVHVGAVRLLTGDYANPNKSQSHDQMMYVWASQGNEDVIRLLLTREELNPDKPNHHGQTPLAQACSRGNEEVVRILLTREEVNPNEPDNDGRTPLSQAAGRGHEGVVRLLLTQDDVNPDEPDNDGRTALWWAFIGQHKMVAALLRPRTSIIFQISMTLIFAVVLGVGLLQVGDTLIITHVGHTLTTLVSFLYCPGQKYPPCLASWNGYGGIVALLQRRKSVFFESSDQRLFRICWRLSLVSGLILFKENNLSYFIYVIQVHAFKVFFLLVFGTRLPPGRVHTLWCELLDSLELLGMLTTLGLCWKRLSI